MKLSLSYYDALSLRRLIENASIAGASNVLRSRLLRLLTVELQDFEKEKDRLLEENAERTPDGKPITRPDPKGVIVILKNNGQEFNAAFTALIKESLITIEATDDQTEQAFKLMRKIVSTDLCPEIKGEDAARFGTIHEAIVAATSAPPAP